MKRTLLSILLLLTVGLLSAQNELVIQLKTDKYAIENNWKLTDLKDSLIAQNGTLANETWHYDTIQVTNEQCLVWTIYDKYGDGMNSIGAKGDFKIYYNGTLVDSCHNPNFGFSYSVYGLGGGCLPQFVVVNSISVTGDQSFKPVPLSANISNFGTDTIKSVEISYALNNEVQRTETIESLSVPMGKSADVAFTELISFTNSGMIDLTFTVNKINGIATTLETAAPFTETINVIAGYAQKPMHEVFTSSTCPPCNPGNKNIDGVLKNYPGDYALVKYQVNFPGAGDPYYTTEVGRMMGFYGVNAVPGLVVNNSSYDPAGYNTSNFDAQASKISDYAIILSGQLLGDSVFAEVEILTTKSTSSNIKIRTMVVEKVTYDNKRTNGETEFHNVFMKFLTNWNGDVVSGLQPNQNVTLNYSASLAGTNVEEFSDLRLVVYIYTASPYKILQSEMIDLPYQALEAVISSNMAPNATNVALLPEIKLYSSQPLELTSGEAITSSSNVITFVDAANAEVSYTMVYNPDSNLFIVTPTAPLNENTTYTVSLVNVQTVEGMPVQNPSITFTTLDETSSVADAKIPYLKVYPNPATDVVEISAQTNLTYSLCDATGKILLSVQNPAQSHKIGLSELAKGIYILVIQNGVQTETQKLIKQ